MIILQDCCFGPNAGLGGAVLFEMIQATIGTKEHAYEDCSPESLGLEPLIVLLSSWHVKEDSASSQPKRFAGVMPCGPL